MIKPLKVVVDGGNGMAGPMVGPLLEQLGLDLVTTYWTPDGSFPDHEPNPLLEENRRFIIDKVREEGADLGIAWDGDADRCFFIDDTGTFVDGDFLTALLAESILEKQPGADILYDVRASRAVPDLVERLGGKAHMNRVGHAFFKVRMRDEGGAFGGEVSGHYYFADFYNADSGTVPALLILELLSKKDAKLSELVEQFRSEYFISRRDQLRGRRRRRQDGRDRGEVLRRRDHQAGRHLRRLRRLALQRARVEHGAAAAPEPREPRLQGGHGAPARRGAAVDPLVSGAIHRMAIPTPFMVGRVNCYLIDDDPLTLVDTGPNSGKALDCLERALAGARPPDRGPRADRDHPPAPRPPRAGRRARPPLAAPRSCALDLLAPLIEDFGAEAERDDELAEALMLRHGIPRDVVTALRAVSRSFRGWGGSTHGHAPAGRRRGAGVRRAHAARRSTARATPPRTRSSSTRPTGRCWPATTCIQHISSNPLISRQLGGKSGEPGDGRPRALLTYLASLRETREMEISRRSCPATATRSATTRR